ncbi:MULTISPECIES: hypothetical protein [unclassified Neisseria]|uniref:hypothetical protein n=1 Tax=unclassified Neisseria TaxID=2623750 RepID=UPI0010726E10|nr:MULTISPECIES: hypothetical protein [unclassified Neisseria]MBF0803743.1 hypothetical protein [Neisseria sp. 19428wB4_WF04]TFU43567.1 hypothetical protein E4T99_05135 [Neisseria sp. WF04]
MPHGNERSKQKGRLKPEVIQTAFGHLPHHKNTITIIQTLIIGNRHRLYHTENPISLPAPAVAASVRAARLRASTPETAAAPVPVSCAAPAARFAAGSLLTCFATLD